jgi:hypothetical protein
MKSSVKGQQPPLKNRRDKNSTALMAMIHLTSTRTKDWENKKTPNPRKARREPPPGGRAPAFSIFRKNILMWNKCKIHFWYF